MSYADRTDGNPIVLCTRPQSCMCQRSGSTKSSPRALGSRPFFASACRFRCPALQPDTERHVQASSTARGPKVFARPQEGARRCTGFRRDNGQKCFARSQGAMPNVSHSKWNGALPVPLSRPLAAGDPATHTRTWLWHRYDSLYTRARVPRHHTTTAIRDDLLRLRSP